MNNYWLKLAELRKLIAGLPFGPKLIKAYKEYERLTGVSPIEWKQINRL